MSEVKTNGLEEFWFRLTESFRMQKALSSGSWQHNCIALASIANSTSDVKMTADFVQYVMLNGTISQYHEFGCGYFLLSSNPFMLVFTSPKP